MTVTDRDEKGFTEAAKEMAETILQASRASIVAHIDADGVTAASIASASLERAGIPHEVRFIKKLDRDEIDRINREEVDLTWLADLGSGSYSKLVNPAVCVTDHHVPDVRSRGVMVSGQNSLLCFMSRHVNPHLYGIDGAVEISGAGTTYYVARQMDPDNRDLSPLAIVGAVGDFQDSSERRLQGFNRLLLAEATERGFVREMMDIRLFGRETRPLARFLQYSTDPYLPGLTGDHEACKAFLQQLEVEEKEGDRWRCWVDLTEEERRRVINQLADLLIDRRRGLRSVRRLIGHVYLLDREETGTELHDAKEFATLLNACGRYGEAKVGMAVCKGNREETLLEALRLQRSHRETIAGAIDLVKEIGIKRGQWVQHFHAKDQVSDSVVGIVAGMVLGSGEIDSDLPILAFAFSEDDTVKVSARGTRDLVQRGLDLASAMKIASERLGGSGGGHNIAAGASIPMEREQEFLQEVESIIEHQLLKR